MISYQKWEYDMFKHHFKRSFSIELDDQNCFPNEKDFVYPNSLVIQAALENYCLKNGIHLEYLYWMEKQNILPKHNLSADDFILDTL